MTINHINLCVADVAAAIRLFETCFDFTCDEIKGDHQIAVLSNTAGFSLVLMSNALNKSGNNTYPDAFHIGFLQESREAVTDIYNQLKAAGIAPGREPGKIRDSFGFYFHFDLLMIEVAHYS